MSRSFYLSALLPLAIPPLVFLFCAMTAGLSPADSISAAVDQFSADKQNLFVIGAIGLFPVALLLGVLWIYKRSGGDVENRRAMGWGGLVPVLLVLIWVNFQFWPSFLPGRVYPGFPHGLEFIIGPGFFAPALMLLGVGAVWLARRFSAK